MPVRSFGVSEGGAAASECGGFGVLIEALRGAHLLAFFATAPPAWSPAVRISSSTSFTTCGHMHAHAKMRRLTRLRLNAG